MAFVVRRDDLYRRRCRLGFAAIGLTIPVVLVGWAPTLDAGLAVKAVPMVLWLVSRH